MLDISKAQEREERHGLGRGMIVSVFGLLFCWAPGLGLLLAGVGFCKVASRVTVRHRARRGLYVFVSFLILVAAAAALMAECYLYVQNPNIIKDTGMRVYTWVTGETELPGASDPQEGDGLYQADGGGVNYDNTGAAGLGLDTSIYGYDGDDVWSYNEEDDVSYQDDFVSEGGG